MLIANLDATKCFPPYMIDGRRRSSDARQGRVSGVSGDGACDGQQHDPTLPSPARRCSANAKHRTSATIPSHLPSLTPSHPALSTPPTQTSRAPRLFCATCDSMHCLRRVSGSSGVRESVYRRRGTRSPITWAVRGSGDRRQY